ncbi:MAG TPA: DUF192 domain-containing protein [Spirochaetia bacterium]|nr:DUF192 domain-containing protein [Spirochaetia bacterium]
MLKVARGLLARTRGLIGSDGDYALLIPKCNWIHTFFMSYTIDVYYLDPEGRVVKNVLMEPGKFTRPVRGAVAVLEIPPGLDWEGILRECADLFDQGK